MEALLGIPMSWLPKPSNSFQNLKLATQSRKTKLGYATIRLDLPFKLGPTQN